MNLKADHYAAIQLLIENRFTRKTEKEIAAELGVTDRTLRKWKADPGFQAAYESTLDRWLKNLEDVRFRHRKERVLELQRLYDETPDSYIDKFLRAKASSYDPESKTWIDVDANIIDEDGKILRDDEGNPISVVAVRKMNVDAKAKLLKQIAEEVGDVVEKHQISGDPANPIPFKLDLSDLNPDELRGLIKLLESLPPE